VDRALRLRRTRLKELRDLFARYTDDQLPVPLLEFIREDGRDSVLELMLEHGCVKDPQPL